MILVLGLTGWLGICRIVRSQLPVACKQLEYVEAAIALGYCRYRIMFRHILPNALQPIIVYGTIAVGGVILSEAALSFLGSGPTDPTPAWGLMVSEGKSMPRQRRRTCSSSRAWPSSSPSSPSCSSVTASATHWIPKLK